jgi:uncharacterized repeat protein (TIGR02543 family)
MFLAAGNLVAQVSLNDNFENADVIASAPGTVDVDTSTATAESGEPAHYGGAPRHTLWWRYLPLTNGTLVVDTEGSAFDTVLALYTGSSLATLQKRDSNDSAGDDVMHSRIELLLAGGTTYHIALDGYSESDNGAARLNWVFTPLAANSYIVTLMAPQVIGYPSNIVVTAGTPYSVLPQPSIYGYAFNGWWSGMGGTGDQVTNAISVSQSTNHALYAKFSPKTVSVTFDANGSTVPQQVVEVTFGLAWPAITTPTREGYVFDGWYTLEGEPIDLGSLVALESDLSVFAEWIASPLPPPVNDNFAAASVITTDAGSTNVTTAMASAEPEEPAHYGGAPRHTLWWTFIPLTNGTLVVDTEGSSFDTVLALYTGSSLATLQKLASNDSAGDDVLHSRIEWMLVGGTTYHIALDGYSESDSGSACLNWGFTPLPANYYIVPLTSQSVSAVVPMGQTARLIVSNSGAEPFYQWMKDGVMLAGQTNSTLSFNSFTFTDSGSYSVVVTNTLGTTISMPASLSTPNAPLRGWGRNNYGQLGNGTNVNTSLPITVEGNVVATACGSSHSLFVKADGTLWAMGYNNSGQLGTGAAGGSTNRPIQVASNVVAVASGYEHSLFVKADGTLWAMGQNNYGQLGNGTTNNASLPVQVASNVVAAASGYEHSLFVKADGTLWAMGKNHYGQLGNGTINYGSTSVPVNVASNVVTVAGAQCHSLFVKADGTLWAMGYNGEGELGIGTTGGYMIRPVHVASNVVATAGGSYHSLFVKADGTLWAMGYNFYGQLGNGTTANTNRPVQVASNVVNAAGGAFHSLFVKADGTLWAMGQNTAGQLGNGSTANTNLPVQVSGGLRIAGLAKEPQASHSLAIAGAVPAVTVSNLTVTFGQMTNFTASVAGDGPFTYQWQKNGTNIVDAINDCYTISSASMSDAGNYAVIVAGACGITTSVVATLTVNKATPSVTVWPTASDLTLGQALAASTLSNGAGSVAGAFAFTTPETVPTAGTTAQGVIFTPTEANLYNSVTGSVSVIVITAPAITEQPMSAVVTIGQEVTLSVSNSITALFGYQWIKDGVMLAGQTNSSLSFSSFTFTDSGSYSVVVTNILGTAISMPANLSVPNAPLRGWGRNNYGQLGNGMAANTNPQITVASNVVAAAGGSSHSLFVKADGTLWAMGYNNVGQLGNGTTANTNLPIQVASNVVAAAGGSYHSLFVKADGTLWAMGFNGDGELGNGTTTTTNRPVQVASNVVAAAGGLFHSLFVKADGTLWAMGFNNTGQLGNGKTANTSLPVQVASNVVAAAGGSYHSLFVKADGTLWAMGQNNFGQLGNGTTNNANLPVQVASNVVTMASGNNHSLFVKADGTLWAMGQNNFGQLGNGTTNNANLPVQVASHVVATAGGANHSLFMKADGTLWAMGLNTSGQLGNGTTVTTNLPIQVVGGLLIGGLAKEPMSYHSLAIAGALPVVSPLSNRTVTFGQTTNFTASVTNGDGPFTYQWQKNGANIVDATNGSYTVSSASISDAGNYAVVVAGACGSTTSSVATLTVKADQTITFPVISGKITTDTVGLSATASSGLPVSFSVLSGLASISGGTNLTFSGTGSVRIVASQAGDANWNAAPHATNTFTVSKATPSITSWPTASALMPGQTLASSTLSNGAASVDGAFAFTVPSTLPAVTASQDVTFTPTQANLYNSVTGSVSVIVITAPAITDQPMSAVVTIGQEVTLSVSNNVTALHGYQWIKDGVMLAGQTNRTLSFSSFTFTDSGSYSVVITNILGTAISMPANLSVPNAPLRVWGNNANGQLGNGTTTNTNLPITMASNVVAATGGESHSLFVKSDGTLWAMGKSNCGQLGNGTTTNTNLPVQVASNVAAAAGGGYHSLFVKADGTLWAMGSELSNGTTASTNRPVQVASNVVATAGGYAHSLFVKADGTLWAMGYNNYGQLGNGTMTNTNLPVQVASNVVTVVAGSYHSLFVKTDGTLWAMGYNSSGQLGNGTTVKTNLPVQVASNVVAATGGSYHSLFVKADGTLWAMGRNGDGQLGNGTTANTNLPVQVASHVVAAAGGLSHSLFVKADGTLWAMGQNTSGQLGNGTTNNANLPVQVSGSLLIAGLTKESTAYHSLAIAGAVPAVTVSNRTVTFGQTTNFTATVTGDGPFTYQWQKNGTNIVDATNGTYTISSAVWSDVGNYAVVVAGAYGSTTSADATLTVNKASQTVNFENIGDQLTTNIVALSATATSGLSVTNFSVVSGPAVISAGSVSFTNSGSVTLSAVQDGNADYDAAATTFTFSVTKAVAEVSLSNTSQTYDGTAKGVSVTTVPAGKTVSVTYNSSATLPVNAGSYTVVATISEAMYQGGTMGTLTITKASQTVSFENIGDQLTTNIVALSATATSGLSVTNFSVVSGPAVISAGSVSFTNSGSVTLSAVQVGNADYDASPATNISFSVSKALASVSLSNTNQTYDGTAKSVSVTTVPAGRTVSVTYNSSATIPTHAGSYTVVATISEAMYQGGTTGTLTISKASQTVNFENIGDQLTTNVVILSATATSGLSVTNFSVVSGPAVISATSLSFTNSGSVTLSAVQVGNADYDASLATNISFSVSKAVASVSLSNTNQTYDGTAKNVSVTTVPAGQTVSVTYNSSATIPTHAGSYTVVATVNEIMYQGGTTGTLTISKASQTVNFENIGDQLTTNIVALSATATSGLSVTNFSVVSGPAVISAGTNLTFSGAGIVKIVASQAGDANWNAAPTVTNTVTVSKATPSITSWPTASALMHGQTLAFSTLSSGAASVGGAFAFTVPSIIPAVTASQSVTFTPIDANRYNSVTGSVSVTVIAKPAITAQPISAVVTMGQAAGLSVSNSGSAPLSYQWLKDGVILLGQTNSTLNFASFKFVDSGSYSVVITNALGMVISVPASLSVPNAPLWAMGYNGSGQLGNGTMDSIDLPVQMASNVVVAACGGDHSLFVNADGTLWGMGLNYDGQLGNPMTGWEADLPVQVASNVVGVAGGFSHSLFVKTDGTLWAMGLNNYGQLGNGTTTSTNRPVQVSSNVVAVAAGYYHSLFVKANGTLWAMGWNSNGRLGNGTTVNARLPVQVASNVVTVASGNDHSLFVKADGTLWGMGDNNLGQLGVDLAANTTRPVLVMSNVVSAAAGYAHTLIIKADGTLWGMGNNVESELGLGVEVDTTRPVLVTSNVVAAAGGTYHSLFVKADGKLWGMGNNSSGQLGDGTWETTNQPVLVNNGGLIAVSVARGSSAYHSLAIAGTLPMVSVSNLTVTVGQTTNFTAIVTGDGLFTYQWQFNGTNIVDATNHFYTISSATVSDAGDYVVLVTGTSGTATSAIATLTVNKLSQTVNFPNIGDQLTTNVVTLNATASSGLIVTNFSVVSGPAVISAGCVSFTNSGSVTLSAVQDGDSRYSAAPAVTISFMVLASSYTLTVTSAHGGSDPAGTNSYDTPISVMITNSPVFIEATQYVCTGWTGTGSVPASGTTTNTGLFAMTQESTLVWLWATNYLLKVDTIGNGSVSTSNVWLASGTPFQVSVTPDPYYHFAGWSGHAEGETSNPLTLAMNSARSVTANFLPNLTPNTSTPEYWLAQYGLTNFNTDALADADLDGMKTWQEYIAGTDPTNAASKFQITQTQMEGAVGTNFVIRWSSVAGKLYAVDATTNLLEGFPLNRGRDILATPSENVLTIRVDRASQEFFRIRIQP